MQVIKGFCFLLVFVLVGCSSSAYNSGVDYDRASGGGRYSILQDHGPLEDFDVSTVPDLIPRYEPYSRGGNKSPYQVWGKEYYVMPSAEGYVAEGTASWYGQKFHGHKTSNGETYDMFTFSAAHKSLPLPTFLKVTNLDNQRSVVVRVNDRGPFHGDRLIDLSYAAAARLGYHKTGTARVRVEAITLKPGQRYSASSTYQERTTVAPTAGMATPISMPTPIRSVSAPIASVKSVSPVPANVASSSVTQASTFNFIQLGAFSQEQSASQLKRRLLESFDTQIKIRVLQVGGLLKVVVGPYGSDQELNDWQQKLEDAGFGKSVKVAIAP